MCSSGSTATVVMPTVMNNLTFLSPSVIVMPADSWMPIDAQISITFIILVWNKTTDCLVLFSLKRGLDYGQVSSVLLNRFFILFQKKLLCKCSMIKKGQFCLILWQVVGGGLGKYLKGIFQAKSSKTSNLSYKVCKPEGSYKNKST